MSSLINFDFQSQTVRVELKNGEPLFCLTDVATILEISNANPSRFNLSNDGVHKMYSVDSKGRKNEITFISEPNLYRVIFRSNKAEAVKFQNWVFDEVLPSIRKTGQYTINRLTSDDTLPLRNAVNMATGVLRLDYATIYKMVHQRFGVDEIKELSKDEVEQAVEYIHRLIVQAEPAEQYKNLDFITQLFNTKEKELKQAYQRVNRLSELIEQLPAEHRHAKIDMNISLNDIRHRLNNLVKSTSLLQKTTLPA